MKKSLVLPIALTMIHLAGCTFNAKNQTPIVAAAPVPTAGPGVAAPTILSPDSNVANAPILSSIPTPTIPTESVTNGPLGGKLENSMDTNDKTKLSQAMDKAVGKTTTWENALTRIHFSATPIQKVTINGNPFCRRYQIKALKNNEEQIVSGTACVSSLDGSWQVVSY